MDFYSRKSAFHRDLQKYITDIANANKRVSLAILRIRFGQRYGFSEKQIREGLAPYVNLGHVEIEKDLVIIRGKKSNVADTSNKVASVPIGPGPQEQNDNRG